MRTKTRVGASRILDDLVVCCGLVERRKGIGTREVRGARKKGGRGSDPRLLRLTMDGLLDRTFGERPRASRIVRVRRLDLPADYVGVVNISSVWSKPPLKNGWQLVAKKKTQQRAPGLENYARGPCVKRSHPRSLRGSGPWCNTGRVTGLRRRL